jgi:hypothetical protein
MCGAAETEIHIRLVVLMHIYKYVEAFRVTSIPQRPPVKIKASGRLTKSTIQVWRLL